MLQEYIPYQYDATKIPECALTNQLYYNTTFCLQDDYYPVSVFRIFKPKVAPYKEECNLATELTAATHGVHHH